MANAILESIAFSGGTGSLTVAQSKSLAAAVAESVKNNNGAMVTLSMKGISSMSPDASAALFGTIVRDKELATKVAIRGVSPYMQEVMYMGMRKAKI